MEEDLDALLRCVADEANHEPNRRRRRDLNELFAVLDAAAEVVRYGDGHR